MNKIKILLLSLLGIGIICSSCEKSVNEPQSPEPEIPQPKPMPEATYELRGTIKATDFVAVADGMRNDYISFYDEQNFYTLFIDFYTDESNAYLPSGNYALSPTKLDSAYNEYSYFTLTPSSDLERFTDGWVEVIADENDPSGYLVHKIRAYFTLISGESVSMEYSGTILSAN